MAAPLIIRFCWGGTSLGHNYSAIVAYPEEIVQRARGREPVLPQDDSRGRSQTGPQEHKTGGAAREMQAARDGTYPKGPRYCYEGYFPKLEN